MPLSESSPDWDALYRDRVTPWDKGSPAPPLVEWIEANPGRLEGHLLVPGCGLGHDVRLVANQPGVETVTGLDLSPTATAQAREFPPVGRERYVTGDLFALSPEHQGRYDWIWEHTCFCAIDPDHREDYVRAVHGALKTGGSLLAVFYLNPYDDEHQPGGGPPHGCSLEELEERFAASGRFRIEESYVPESAYPGREGLERLVRMTRL